MKLPKISVNIPALPGEDLHIVLDSLKKVKYPSHLFEIIIVRGNQIAKQRNKAIQKSKGDIIYLLDNDSEVAPRAFRIIAKELSQKKVAAVGGPSLTPEIGGNYLNQLIGYALGTFFGAFRMRYKWSKQEAKKHGIDYYFIGANLALKKDAVLKVGGFDEDIVPNEETELLRRLRNSGYKLKYNRNLYIHRYQRGTFNELFDQFWHYGRGRMKQIAKYPIPQDCIFVIPVFFMFYSISLIWYRPFWYVTPLIFYGLLGLATASKAAFKYKRPDLLVTLPFVFPVIHFAYACGLLEEATIAPFRAKSRKTSFMTPKVLFIKKFNTP